MIRAWGGEPVDLGILPDRIEAIEGIAGHAKDADLVVTLGGASVGDHDLIQKALGPKGFALDFWKIAMRPGKPLIFGRLGETPLLGLPGNPVSTLVCAILFLQPAIAALLGTSTDIPRISARLAGPLGANDRATGLCARAPVRARRRAPGRGLHGAGLFDAQRAGRRRRADRARAACPCFGGRRASRGDPPLNPTFCTLTAYRN